jgi:2-polyprenyl-3-methyl-5-hydroxy-6-metoxy-1,4-benzoquinol methylase
LKEARVVSHFICLDCKGGFWFPTISGDPDFYESVTSLYVDRRWDKTAVKKRVKWSNSILDVGAGPDPIFNSFKGTPTKIFVALDINPIVNKNKSQSYIQFSRIESLVSSELRFENIVALHFLEHINNPIEYFKTLSLLLKNGGSIWISVPNKDRKERTKPFEVLDTPPHHVTSWNIESLRNFAKLLDLDLINAWASKGSSNSRIIRGIRRCNISREFSRIVFYKVPLLGMGKPRGFQLLVQLKIRRV